MMQCHISLCFFFCKSSAAVWPAGAREERTEREKARRCWEEYLNRNRYRDAKIKRASDTKSRRWEERTVVLIDLLQTALLQYVQVWVHAAKRRRSSPYCWSAPYCQSITESFLCSFPLTSVCTLQENGQVTIKHCSQPSTWPVVSLHSKIAAMESSIGHLCNIKRMPAINILNLPSNLSGIYY